MKEIYRIFVEGPADKRFIEQLMEFVFNEKSLRTTSYQLTATQT